MNRGVQPRVANLSSSKTKFPTLSRKKKDENYNPCQNFSGLLFGYSRTGLTYTQFKIQMTYLPCLLTPMTWARYTDNELLWLFDTPRKLLRRTEVISIQGLLHVGLHCNKVWSAEPAPGDQQHRAWLGTWPRGAWYVSVGPKSKQWNTLLLSPGYSLLFTEATRSIKPDQNTPLARLLGLKTTPFPHRNCEKHTLESGTPPVHNV